MSEIIERVARVLEPQAWAALGLCDTLAYKNRRTSSLRKAKASLEAMREPTNEMKAAMEPWTRVSGHQDGVWKAGIDAALKEKGPTAD